MIIASIIPLTLAIVGTQGGDASHDWTRFGWDAARTNSSRSPAGITTANAGSLQRQQVAIDGTVDASVIYLRAVQVGGAAHDVFFATTTYGRTLAVDADRGTILWRYTPPGYDQWAGSYQITNATPVADPDRAFIYAASPDGHIQKLAIADGHAAWSTAITLLPRREKIASALNYFHGRIIATTGGYIGDRAPYQGHVAILDATSGRLLHVWNSLCSDRQGLIEPGSCSESGSAIWGRAGAVIDTTTGNILVATGNGLWDGRRHWGDAVLELDPDATRLIGNYTPTNTEALNNTDTDVGSTSPVLLDGTLVQGGKDGTLRVLDRTRMGGVTPHRGGERQVIRTPSGSQLFTAPAAWQDGATTWLFAADNGGTAAWTLADGRMVARWQNANAGTSPVVAGRLLYVFDPSGRLRIYQADTGHELAALECGHGHWNSSVVADGMIALPEGNANDHRTTGVLNIWRVR